MSSQIEICNMALSRLGSSRIISLGDNTVESKTLNAIYNQVAKFVMAMGPWPSVKCRAVLAQTTTTPAFGFSYQYQLPVDPKCLKVLRLNELKLGDVNYQVEGDKIICDEAAVSILYIGYITDTEQYDAYLEQAIINQLVVEMAYSRTGQFPVASALMQDARKQIEDLLNNACTQNPSEDIPSDMFTDIRNES